MEAYLSGGFHALGEDTGHRSHHHSHHHSRHAKTFNGVHHAREVPTSSSLLAHLSQPHLNHQPARSESTLDAPPLPTSLFSLFRDLKRGSLLDRERSKEAKYHNGFFGRLVKHRNFEICTMTVITANALAIGYDTDYAAQYGKPHDLYSGPLFFIIIENFFAVYFTCEVFIRLLAYKHACRCWCDPWFVFDSCMAGFMILETWVLAFIGGSHLGQLTILRLLRLLRITRLAKMMKLFPELMMILHGMVAAARAVVWTAALLIVVTYMWSILFTSEYHQGLVADDELEDGDVAVLFGSMGKSFLSLIVMGTILDDVTLCTDSISSTGNHVMLLAFVAYVLFNSFTMLNMLVGVLVEMVANTAAGDKVDLIISGVRKATKKMFVNCTDEDEEDNTIMRDEFLRALTYKSMTKPFAEMGITRKQMEMYAEMLFPSENSCADYDTVVDLVLRLKPSNHMSTLDFMAFKSAMVGAEDSVSSRITQVESLCDKISNRLQLVASKRGKYSGILDEAESRLHQQQPQPVASPLAKVWGPPAKNSPMHQPWQAKALAAQIADPSLQKINLQMLDQLEFSPHGDIIAELHRRLGMTNFEEIGIPIAMLDDELQARVHNGCELVAIEIPNQPQPPWPNSPPWPGRP